MLVQRMSSIRSINITGDSMRIESLARLRRTRTYAFCINQAGQSRHFEARGSQRLIIGILRVVPEPSSNEHVSLTAYCLLHSSTLSGVLLSHDTQMRSNRVQR